MKADRTPKAIGGRYKILEPLGQGGVGSVFKAVDSRLGRIVAIKVFKKRQGDWRFSEHPQREADASSRLSYHPNIVSVFERGETEDHTFQVMEFVEGSQLSAILARKEPLHWEYAIELVRQVASGLSAAHACGLVHRDVKPSNILVSRDGRVLLTDFGLSARTTDPAVTAIGTIVGTPAYMSPEQVRGKQVDARSDIFSLGAVLYELLTGHRPFTGGGSVTGVLSAIVNDPPEPICRGNPSVPAAIEQVVLKALEKKPPQRYQSIDEFRGALA